MGKSGKGREVGGMASQREVLKGELAIRWRLWGMVRRKGMGRSK